MQSITKNRYGGQPKNQTKKSKTKYPKQDLKLLKFQNFNFKTKNMKKVYFRDQDGNDLFVENKPHTLDFFLPRENETLICLGIVMLVTSITHNYDAKEIIVNVKVD